MNTRQEIIRVLGIDPGYGRCGWAVVEGNRVHQELVAYGCIETNNGLSVSGRLGILYEEIRKLAALHSPNMAAVEELYFFKNQKTVMQVGQARGAIVVALGQSGLPVFDYTPLQVKQTVTGYGRAEKAQVQLMVKSILKLSEVPKPDDAADAVAVALTHLYTNLDLA